MQEFKITIRKIIDIKGEKYPKEETVFEQVVSDIDISYGEKLLCDKRAYIDENGNYQRLPLTLKDFKNRIIQEERKRILDIEFRAPADKSDDWHAGIRYCLEKFRNTISKPNI